MAQDQDSAWKEILEACFRDFLEFFFPGAHHEVDWSQGIEFLDKELERIAPRARSGRRIADKLVKVRLLDGEETWILVHVEVQGRSERGFARRMFDYNHRLVDHYQHEVVSLAVLTGSRPRASPGIYERRRWGCETVFRFPVVKLLDWEDRREELEASGNPFSLVVLSHLDARKARSVAQLVDVKFSLARKLYRHGRSRENVIQLYRFIDWLIRLPREQEEDILRRIETELKGEAVMPYLSNLERFAMEKGREEGRLKGQEEGRQKGQEEGRQKGREEGRQKGIREGLLGAIGLGLKKRFGEAGVALLPRVQAIADADRLLALVGAVQDAETIADVSRLLDRPGGKIRRRTHKA